MQRAVTILEITAPMEGGSRGRRAKGGAKEGGLHLGRGGRQVGEVLRAEMLKLRSGG